MIIGDTGVTCPLHTKDKGVVLMKDIYKIISLLISFGLFLIALITLIIEIIKL